MIEELKVLRPIYKATIAEACNLLEMDMSNLPDDELAALKLRKTVCAAELHHISNY